jgi:phage tail sheath protein FI
MAETLISPGVLARENDQSFVTSQPVERGAAIIGPAVIGPVEKPTLISSFSSYQALFGGALESGSGEFTYLTSIAANQYFQNGGNSLLVTRVTSGSFTSATSSAVVGLTASLTNVFTLETISEGEIMNSVGPTGSNGALTSGSTDNVRWEIVASNSSSGVFSLLIRRGDDTNNNKVVLESYNNISLDPFASNYISRAIGDISTNLITEGVDTFLQESGSFPNISNYVRVKSVNNPTPRYFNNDGTAKNQFTGSLPAIGSGSFGGAVGSNIPAGRAANFYENINATDTQGLVGSDYTNAIALLANQDDYQFNVISVPGLSTQHQSAQITSVMNNSISRGDSIAVIDLVGYNQLINTVVAQAGGIDNSYTATYWPWLQTVDPNSGQLVYIPASTFIPGVYAFTDASSDPWFAPAGITRGGMGQVVRAERRLTSTNRDTLYEANINPIATFPSQGVVVFGQKTLQKAASALDRVNVRRLLITLKSFISQIADNLVFEQNTIATRQNFLTQVNPYLESVQQRQGLYAFKVVMDESNNSPDVIDRNELVGQIFLQPTRTAEFILLDFNVLPTGATFPS